MPTKKQPTVLKKVLKIVFFAQKTLVFGPREGVKYYFADFVRKGGTPPPLWTKFSPKKVTDLGGTPPQWANLGHHVVELAN